MNYQWTHFPWPLRCCVLNSRAFELSENLSKLLWGQFKVRGQQHLRGAMVRKRRKTHGLSSPNQGGKSKQNQVQRLTTNMTDWEITIFNRRYIFIYFMVTFSIVMLVFEGKTHWFHFISRMFYSVSGFACLFWGKGVSKWGDISSHASCGLRCAATSEKVGKPWPRWSCLQLDESLDHWMVSFASLR